MYLGGSDSRSFDGSDLYTYLSMSGLRPDGVSVVGLTGGLAFGFLLLRFSVVYTVESLSLLYLVFISRFVFTKR